MRERYTIKIIGDTDTGLVRSNNQDFFYTSKYDDKLVMAIVADGMGGYKGGDIASKLCTETIVQYINSKYKKNTDIVELLVESVNVANVAVYEYAQENEYLKGMGTTIVIAAFDNDTVHILNIGDSRAYHIMSNNDVRQITDDHTLVNEYFKAGKITLEETKNHMYRHVITRAVGTELMVEPDLFKVNLKNNEHILLCSDGMYEYIDKERLSETLILYKDTSKAIQELISIAKESGGADNITIVIASNKKA